MADEVWPVGIVPWSYQIDLQPNTVAQESPITRKRRYLVNPGKRWRYDMQFRLVRADAQALEALLDRLEGPVRTVALWDRDREQPLGPNLDRTSIAATRFTDGTAFADGTEFIGGAAGIVVWGAHARGAETVTVDGFPAGSTAQLVAGDYVELGGWLYRLTQNASTASAMGRATLSLNRPLRAALAHRAPVVRTRASSPFRLIDDEQARRARQVGSIDTFSVSFVEAL